MTPETLHRLFDVVADAPGGVQRLRELILQLAVRGKLVPQDPNDEPATVLLERVEEEKSRLCEEGKIRKLEKLPPVEPDEVPFDLPANWVWSRLADLGLVNPRNDLDDSTLVSFCPMALIPEGYGAPVEFEVRRWGEIKEGYTHFAENDVVIAKITPCFQNRKGAVMRGLYGGAGAGSTELYVFRPVPGTLEPDYVLIFLKSPQFVVEGKRRMTGTAGQQRLPREYFETTPVPVPPAAEQHRIVAKVDELMALCDELEERQRRRAEKRASLNRSALHHLTTATDHAELAGNWRRIRDHFDLLYEVPETVAELRQAILHLAVRGKLVPQDPNDEPATVLLERIEEEKRRLYEEGKIRKLENMPPVEPDEVPFEVPEGWMWVRLGSLGVFMGGGTPSKSNPALWNGGIPWVTPKDMKQPYIGSSIDTLTTEALKTSSVRLIPSGSLLMVVRGMILARAFPTALTTRDVTINQDMKAFVLYNSAMAEYVLRFLRGVQSMVLALVEQSTHGTCRLDSTHLEMLPVAIPPLAEQHRIVAKVDRLMALCDELEARLTASRTKAEQLASAIVHHMSAA